MNNGQGAPIKSRNMVRLCLIHECNAFNNAPVCCNDCENKCSDRCRNHPERCNCAGDYLTATPNKNWTDWVRTRKKRSSYTKQNLTDIKKSQLRDLLTEGKLKQKEIAKLLDIPVSTVGWHWAKISGGKRYGE